jgi:predicted AAA+ superfamily ATPase
MQARVRSDPRAFHEELQPPVLFDEIQNTPELLDYVRTLVDARPRRVGQWLFTRLAGSSSNARHLWDQWRGGRYSSVPAF